MQELRDTKVGRRWGTGFGITSEGEGRRIIRHRYVDCPGSEAFDSGGVDSTTFAAAPSAVFPGASATFGCTRFVAASCCCNSDNLAFSERELPGAPRGAVGFGVRLLTRYVLAVAADAT